MRQSFILEVLTDLHKTYVRRYLFADMSETTELLTQMDAITSLYNTVQNCDSEEEYRHIKSSIRNALYRIADHETMLPDDAELCRAIVKKMQG